MGRPRLPTGTPEVEKKREKRRMEYERDKERKRAASAAAEDNVITDASPASEEDILDAAVDEHPLDDILSNEEIAAIYAKARSQVLTERKRERAKKLLAEAVANTRAKYALETPEGEEAAELEREVDVTIDLGFFRKQRDLPYLRIDGKLFYHGRTYRVTVAQARSMLPMMATQRMHLRQFYGDSPGAYYDPAVGRNVYRGGIALGGRLLQDGL